MTKSGYQHKEKMTAGQIYTKSVSRSIVKMCDHRFLQGGDKVLMQKVYLQAYVEVQSCWDLVSGNELPSMICLSDIPKSKEKHESEGDKEGKMLWRVNRDMSPRQEADKTHVVGQDILVIDHVKAC